jgi:UDP-3-O-[3-hydroxymyristoyl] glucosamine N-acyltransferase
MRKLRVQYSSGELAKKVGGTLFGSADIVVSEVSSLDTLNENSITFIRAHSRIALTEVLSKRRYSVVLVSEQYTEALNPTRLPPEVFETLSNAVIVVPEAYAAFLDLLPLFYETLPRAVGVHPSAAVHPSAKIGLEVSIGAFCFVGENVTIGDFSTLLARVSLYDDVALGERVLLHSGVIVREGCSVGDQCIVHNNTVIGADGFGYIPDQVVGLRKVPQLGTVQIGSDVEIGANSCIDRGALGATTIGKGTKIDNLVQVGHNATIGESCVLCGGVGIGGSSVLGNGVVIGGNSGVADHVTIVSGVRVGGQSGVHSSLLTPGDYLGFPVMPAGEWRRAMSRLVRDARGKRGKRETRPSD